MGFINDFRQSKRKFELHLYEILKEEFEKFEAEYGTEVTGMTMTFEPLEIPGKSPATMLVDIKVEVKL